MGRVRNCFLIRDPAEVVTSMADFRALAHDPGEGARLAGIPQLARIFDKAWALEGRAPLVIDANDLLADPPGVLTLLRGRRHPLRSGAADYLGTR